MIWQMQKNALLFGMTLQEFWEGNPDLFYLYQDCFIDKLKMKRDEDNGFAWLQGNYFLQAFRQGLSEALSKNRHEFYPKEPYKSKETREENSVEFEKNFLDIMMKKANLINKRFKK